jgi:hypothetical protein
MDELRMILLQHRDKYPSMTFIDYLKLIYQNVFGPHHFADRPDLEGIINGIFKEVELVEGSNPDLFVDIGNDYVRVDLRVINQQIITAEELGKHFFESMKKIPSTSDIRRFREKVNLLLLIIDQGLISISLSEKSAVLSKLDYSCLAPFSHSKIYKEAYQPHYRVIEKHLLDKYRNISK